MPTGSDEFASEAQKQTRTPINQFPRKLHLFDPMVIAGGYETCCFTFAPGRPSGSTEWLSHVNAGLLKVKIGHGPHRTTLISDNSAMWQLLLHLTFILSAALLAITDWITVESAK